MVCFNETFNDINFDISFEDKVNVFSGMSGEGKTFLFTVLESYFIDNDISYQYYNSSSLRFGVSELFSGCTGRSVIIFDNADLYLTRELLDYAISQSDTVIVSMKDFFRLGFTSFGRYLIEYDNNIFRTRRRKR